MTVTSPPTAPLRRRLRPGLNGPPFQELRQILHEGEALGADLFGADRGIGIPDGAPPGKLLPVGSDLVDAAFIEHMKSQGAWYIPTLALDEATFVYADDPPWTHNPFFKKALRSPRSGTAAA